MKKLLGCAILAATMLTSAHAAVTIGTANSANCYPFGCFGKAGGTEYQQVYGASAFSAPIAISSISFYNDGKQSNGVLESASYTFSLSTTSKTVNHLDSSNLANNIGADQKIFGTYTLSGKSSAILTFTGAPFYYNPAQGNLLLDIRLFDFTSPLSNPLFMESSFRDPLTSRVVTHALGTYQDKNGLVTTFNLTPVPEPASYAMLLGGLGLLGLARRRG